MRVSLTVHHKSPSHVSFRVHVNGGLAGELVLRNDEYLDFVKKCDIDKVYGNEEERLVG